MTPGEHAAAEERRKKMEEEAEERRKRSEEEERRLKEQDEATKRLWSKSSSPSPSHSLQVIPHHFQVLTCYS